MSAPASPPPGDQARLSVRVAAPPAAAFRVFTAEINEWWRGGLKYRIGRQRSVVHMEPRVGGRLYESFESEAGVKVVDTGRVTVWEPPRRLVFEWRAVNFSAAES